MTFFHAIFMKFFHEIVHDLSWNPQPTDPGGIGVWRANLIAPRVAPFENIDPCLGFLDAFLSFSKGNVRCLTHTQNDNDGKNVI
jgi:hypothetical protein